MPRTPMAPWVLGGVFVDVDFVLFFSPHFNAVHRVVTHNLLFVTVVAIAAAAVVPTRWAGPHRGVWALAMWIGGLGHLWVDSMLDGNPSNGIGVALAWPWSDALWSPINLVRVAADPPSWDEPLRMAASILSNLWVEVPFYAGAGWILWTYRQRRASGAALGADQD